MSSEDEATGGAADEWQHGVRRELKDIGPVFPIGGVGFAESRSWHIDEELRFDGGANRARTDLCGRVR